MNDQVEFWVNLLSWLLATASLYFVAKRRFG